MYRFNWKSVRSSWLCGRRDSPHSRSSRHGIAHGHVSFIIFLSVLLPHLFHSCPWLLYVLHILLHWGSGTSVDFFKFLWPSFFDTFAPVFYYFSILNTVHWYFPDSFFTLLSCCLFTHTFFNSIDYESIWAMSFLQTGFDSAGCPHAPVEVQASVTGSNCINVKVPTQFKLKIIITRFSVLLPLVWSSYW